MKYTLALLFSLLAFSVSAQYAGRYTLVKLGKQVSTQYHEAAPILSQDGKKLYFFVHNHPQNNQGKEMNKGRFYGASISSDAKHMILFFGNQVGSPRSGLYVSNVDAAGKWSAPKKLNISVRDDDFGPFISPDDNSLYFASDRNVKGKHGKADIYQVKRLDDTWQNWGEPVNLSPPINTGADEFYFCIDKAGNVFTSRANDTKDGGNLDIFKMIPKDIKVMLKGTVLNEKTQQPMQADLIITPAANTAINLKAAATGKFETKIPEVAQYTVHATQVGFLPKDLSFDIPPLRGDTTLTIEVLLTPVAKELILTGTTFDLKTNNPLTTKLSIALKSDRKTNFNLQAEGGKYQQKILKLGWYMLTASADGYLNGNDSVEVISEEISPIIKDVFLQPIEVGLTVRLRHIYFDFDKTTLKKESFVELNKVVDFLKKNSTVEIEIAGHTDNKGSDDYNQNLSQGRCESVVKYLVSQGIEDYRLSAHGYGESKPIETNDTEEGRANNRRVEVTVVKK